MKTIQKITGIFAAFALVLSSCDYVEQPLQNPVDPGAEECPEPVFPANPNTQRNVLLEEFTGHTCGPCPGAGKVARDLIAHYESLNKHFIVVSEHTFGLAVPYPAGSPKFTTDFRTDDGDYFANNLFTPAISYTPVAFVNRASYLSSVWVDKADFQGAADACFAKPLDINLQMIVDYDSTEKKGCIHVQSEFETTMSGDFYLVVYLTQDSIVDWQTNGGSAVGDPAYPLNQDVSNYVHRHVMRGCITPKLGVQVISGNVSAGQQIVKTVTLDLNTFPKRAAAPAFVQKDLALVAYVYNSSTKEIIQVIEEHLLHE